MPRARETESSSSGLKTRHYYILLSLSAGDRHGLAVARDVHHLSDGQIRLWPATLYGSFDELCQHGWIEEVDEARGRSSEKKRFYRLTRAGRGIVAAETARLAALVRVARARMKPRAGESS
jgi:DNA-binding PadR family transcriptional regulator